MLEALVAGKDVLATGFRKSFIKQVFCVANISKACAVVISPLNSIVVERVSDLNELGLQVVQLSERTKTP